MRWRGRIARARWRWTALGTFSFLETIVVPVPMELVIVPWMIREPSRLWRIATVTLIGCLLAALAGYAVGVFLFDTAGEWMLSTYGHADAYARFEAHFRRWGFWAILAVGILPIPFQAAMLAAGATGYSPVLFFTAALISRGVRYYGLALLVRAFGAYAPAIRRRLGNRVLLLLALIIAMALVARLMAGL